MGSMSWGWLKCLTICHKLYSHVKPQSSRISNDRMFFFERIQPIQQAVAHDFYIVDKNLLFGKKYRENGPCESTQIQPHDVVGATDWLKLKAVAMKGADADTVTGGG
jgi:hypothetical protein